GVPDPGALGAPRATVRASRRWAALEARRRGAGWPGRWRASPADPPGPGSPAARRVRAAGLLRIESRAADGGQRPGLSARTQVLGDRPVALLRSRRVPRHVHSGSRSTAGTSRRRATRAHRTAGGTAHPAQHPVPRGAARPRALPLAAFPAGPRVAHLRVAPHLSVDPQLLDARVQPLLPPFPQLPLLRRLPRAHALVDGEPAAGMGSLPSSGFLPGSRGADASLVATSASVPPGGDSCPRSRAAPDALPDRVAAPGSRRTARAARAHGLCLRPSIAVRGPPQQCARPWYRHLDPRHHHRALPLLREPRDATRPRPQRAGPGRALAAESLAHPLAGRPGDRGSGSALRAPRRYPTPEAAQAPGGARRL